MFQPIFDAIVYLWDFIKFWVVVAQYEEAIVMRLGNYNRTLTSKSGPFKNGLHFLWPCGVEHILTNMIIPDTTALDSQSLTTADGIGITVEVVVKFRVSNIKDYLLKITDQEAAFADISSSAVSDIVTTIDYTDLLVTDISDQIKEEIQSKIINYGIDIESVAFRTMQKCRTFRIINDSVPLISR